MHLEIASVMEKVVQRKVGESNQGGKDEKNIGKNKLRKLTLFHLAS